jgi:hypothetical protein
MELMPYLFESHNAIEQRIRVTVPSYSNPRQPFSVVFDHKPRDSRYFSLSALPGRSQSVPATPVQTRVSGTNYSTTLHNAVFLLILQAFR